MGKKSGERKGKKAPRKRNRVKKSSLYEAKEGRLERKRTPCPKCGAGVFMAEHENRMSCGKCGYTKWKK
ncbi:MAG: 30S ribosomal protein S27ae [Candidatus Diapherotrites archaeon]|nr:30S ribosomal protein S27ae [Candidatus Diapherotrites archaeon]